MMEDRSGLFNEIQGFSQRKLKKVETKVITGTGDKVVEKRGAKGLQAVAPDATKSAANDGPKKKLDLQVGLVIPGVLIASDDVATHKQTLEEYGVTHILNLCSSIVSNHFEDDYNYCNLDIKDSPTTNIKEYFEECFDFIDEGKFRGNVLVHCDASVPGLSRSTSICVAYLMKSEKKTFNDAYNEVKEARPFVKPNEGFMKQLKEYEKELLGAKKEEEKQDAFTLKKRQEIEAEKEMLKNKISIKDKLKAFAPTLEPSIQDDKANTPSTPNRLRGGWQVNTNSVDKDPSTPAGEERPAPRKLTSILSIFQPKDAKENQRPNQTFVKNTAPTRKWKPVEVTTLQGTKGPEVKKGFSYDKVRKSKSKEWKGREVKKTKSKVLSKGNSVQKDEAKPEPAQFTATVTVNNPTPKKNAQTPTVTQAPSQGDQSAPWRKQRDYSPGNTQVAPQPAPDAPKSVMNKNDTRITQSPQLVKQASQTSRNPQLVKQPSVTLPPPPPPPPQPVKQTMTRQPSLNKEIVIENKPASKPEAEKKEEVPANKRVFGRIPPPPMKIVGRDVSFSDERKSSVSSEPKAPIPTPQPRVTNIKISLPERELPKVEPVKKEPPKPETPKPGLVKTITLEESSEEEEDEEEDEETEEEEEESEEEQPDPRKNSKAGLTRSSTLEILNLIKSKTQVLDDKKLLNTVDENDEIDTLLDGLQEEGIENIDWQELGIDFDEVKNIVDKNKVEESEEEEDEEEDEEEELEFEEEIECS